MENADQKRAQQRLQYRWPVKFSADGSSKPYQGQIADISSRAIAFLCHADQSFFDLGQQIQTSFGVPFFGPGSSFDTVMFERTGTVSRIDKPSSRIHRVVMQFTAPLFFEPGQQGIDQADAQQMLEDKNLSIIKAQESAKAYNEALLEAENKLRQYAQAKATTEEKLKAEIEDRFKTEARLRTEAEQKIRLCSENIARLEEKLRAKAKEIAKIEAIAQKAQKQADSLEKQLAQVKDKAASEIARIKEEAASLVNQFKAKYKDQMEKSPPKTLLEKFDKFISDKNKIF